MQFAIHFLLFTCFDHDCQNSKLWTVWRLSEIWFNLKDWKFKDYKTFQALFRQNNAWNFCWLINYPLPGAPQLQQTWMYALAFCKSVNVVSLRLLGPDGMTSRRFPIYTRSCARRFFSIWLWMERVCQESPLPCELVLLKRGDLWRSKYISVILLRQSAEEICEGANNAPCTRLGW